MRTVPRKLHAAVLTAKAADGLPSIIAFLANNFQLTVDAGQVGRYIWLTVLQDICPGARVNLVSPRFLDRLAQPLKGAKDSIVSNDVETQLIPQAEALTDLLRTGHVVLVALDALNVSVRA